MQWKITQIDPWFDQDELDTTAPRIEAHRLSEFRAPVEDESGPRYGFRVPNGTLAQSKFNWELCTR